MNTFLNNKNNIIHWSIFCFVLAGITGLYYRFAMINSVPFDFSLANVRHAHSHLMFFGWAGLMPLFLIAKLSRFEGKSAIFSSWSLRLVLILSLLTFPSFLMWGYKPVEIGSSSIPISAILSGFVMIGWYTIIIGFLKNHQSSSISAHNIWFGGALIALFLSSLGAWGVGVSGIVGVESPFIGKALTHSFLAVFTEGWVLLFIFGLISHSLNLKITDYIISPNTIIWMILIGAPLTFAFGMAEHTNAPSIMLWARLGSFLIALAIILFLISIFKQKQKISIVWLVPLSFLAIKAIVQISIALFGLGSLTADPTLRVLYLHILLLGSFTLFVAGYLVKYFGIQNIYYYLLTLSVITTITSLILPTPLRPAKWGGIWIYDALAIAAIFPIITMGLIWFKAIRKNLKLGT